MLAPSTARPRTPIWPRFAPATACSRPPPAPPGSWPISAPSACASSGTPSSPAGISWPMARTPPGPSSNRRWPPRRNGWPACPARPSPPCTSPWWTPPWSSAALPGTAFRRRRGGRGEATVFTDFRLHADGTTHILVAEHPSPGGQPPRPDAVGDRDLSCPGPAGLAGRARRGTGPGLRLRATDPALRAADLAGNPGIGARGPGGADPDRRRDRTRQCRDRRALFRECGLSPPGAAPPVRAGRDAAGGPADIDALPGPPDGAGHGDRGLHRRASRRFRCARRGWWTCCAPGWP